MMIFINALALSLTQIPGIIMRYLPFHRKLEKSKRKLILTVYLIFFVIEFFILFIFISKFNMDILTFKKALIWGSFIYVVINCIIIKGRFFQHLFILGMQGIYSLFLHSIVAFIQSTFVYNSSISNQLLLQSILYILLFLITLYPIVIILKNTFETYIREDIPYYWNILWIIPFCLFYSNAIITMNNYWINTFNQLVSRLLTLVGSIVLFKCVTMGFNEKKSKMDVIHNNQLLKLQVSDLNNRFEDIQKNEENLSILRHDMRHRLYLIKTLTKEKNYDEIISLVDSWNDTLEETKVTSFCKNPVINASLSAYIEKAKSNHIEVETDIDIPSNLNIDPSDLAVVILNLMENALHGSLLENSKEEKIIQLSSRYSDNTLVFRIRNKFYGHIDFDENNLPINSSTGHGIGMRSVKAFTDKYNAQISCTFEDNWFSVILFIKGI